LNDARVAQYPCGVLVNTSFNMRGEPIVCTPDDAYRCFMNTEMDYPIMGSLSSNAPRNRGKKSSGAFCRRPIEMKLIYKEDPKEWRKSALLGALGLAILSSLLGWRRHLPVNVWCAVLGALAVAAVGALLQPRWCRGWYRLSLRLGFYSGQFIGRCVLAVFFIFILTPLGWGVAVNGQRSVAVKTSARREVLLASVQRLQPAGPALLKLKP
jgi:hypothetical protein